MKHLLPLLLTAGLLAIAAENLIPNPAMTARNANGTPVGWSQFQKGNLQIPGADGADFTLGLPDDKAATITSHVALTPNRPYLLSFEAQSPEGSLMSCYYEWFSQGPDGKAVYGGGASVKKQTAPASWQAFAVPVMVGDTFHHGYVALRSMNGKPLSFRNVSLCPARSAADPHTGGLWNLDGLQDRYTPKGVIARNDAPVTLCAVPVEPGKHYVLTYDACGRGPVDPAYPFHDITTKIKPAVQCRLLRNDVSNTPQHKTLKFTVPPDSGISHLTFDFSCTTRSPQADVLFSNFALTAVEPDPRDSWRFALIEPCYRDIIFASHPITNMTCQLLTDGSPAVCDIAFNGQNYRQPLNGQRDFRLTIPVADLPDGRYPLVCRLYDNAGKLLKSFTKTVLKVPQTPHEVTAGPDRFLRVDGQPFFLNYLNLRDWSEPYIYYAARHGVNTATLPIKRLSEAAILQRLDLAHKYGIKAIISAGWAEGISPEAYRQTLEKTFTPTIRRHPAFLCYFMVDEPFWRGLPAEPFQLSYDVLRDFDPYHPVWINAAPRGEITDLRPYADACDIWGCDIYPVPAPNSHSGLDDKMMTSVGKYTARMNDVAYGRKPILMCLQGFGWGENPENGPTGRAKIHPSQPEMRFMLLDSLVNGLTAAEFWGSHHVKSADFLELVFDTALDLHNLSGLFLNGRQEPAAATSAPSLRASVWTYQDQYWYIIMNTANASVEGTVDIHGRSCSDLLSWGTTHSRLPDGRLQVAMKPYGFLVAGTAPLPAPVTALIPPNPAFDAQGSPLPAAISKVLDAYDKVEKLKTSAKWIWQSQQELQKGEVCFIARPFTAVPNEKAELRLAVDDASTVFLNGQEIGRTDGWQNMVVFDLTAKLRPGDNLLIIRAEDAGSLPCGVLAELQLGQTIHYSDATWLGLPAASATAPVPPTLDRFRPAKVIAAYGDGAWGGNVLRPKK